MLKFKSGVQLFAADSDYVVAPRICNARAMAMVIDSVAVVELRDKRGFISAIRLTGNLMPNTARPGSYGIVRQVIDDGTHHSILFQHHKLGRAA